VLNKNLRFEQQQQLQALKNVKLTTSGVFISKIMETGCSQFVTSMVNGCVVVAPS